MSEEFDLGSKYQLVIFLLGDQQSGKSWVAQRMVQEFGVNRRFAIADVVRRIVSDPGGFAIPMNQLSGPAKDTPFASPIMIKENQLRQVMRWLERTLPTSWDFRASKYGVSNFPLMAIKTPRELLQYVGFRVITALPKLGHRIIPTLAYLPYQGKTGIYVVDDMRLANQLDLAHEMFQMVYTVGIKPAEKPKKKLEHGDYAVQETDWKSIKPFTIIQNSKDVKEVDEAIKKALMLINDDVRERIANGNVPILLESAQAQQAQYTESRGPLARNQQATENAVFTKASSKDGDILTPNEAIQLYHESGTVDRSGLARNS